MERAFPGLMDLILFSRQRRLIVQDESLTLNMTSMYCDASSESKNFLSASCCTLMICCIFDYLFEVMKLIPMILNLFQVKIRQGLPDDGAIELE